jgi:hypothetical protein
VRHVLRAQVRVEQGRAFRAARPDGELGVRAGRADQRDAGALGAQFPVQRAGETDLGVLGAGVHGLVGAAAETGDRGDDDEIAAVTLGPELLHRRADAPHRAEDVRLHHLGQLGVVHVHDPPVRADAGVGDHGVEPAPFPHGRGYQGVVQRGVAHVARHRYDLVVAELADHLGQPVLAPGAYGHPRARVDQRGRGGGADTRAGARDRDDGSLDGAGG